MMEAVVKQSPLFLSFCVFYAVRRLFIPHMRNDDFMTAGQSHIC